MAVEVGFDSAQTFAGGAVVLREAGAAAVGPGLREAGGAAVLGAVVRAPFRVYHSGSRLGEWECMRIPRAASQL